jgi:hypothetical protein
MVAQEKTIAMGTWDTSYLESHRGIALARWWPGILAYG